MKKSIIALLVIVVTAALIMPGIASAAGGPPEGKGKPAATATKGGAADKEVRKAEKAAAKEAKAQAKAERKAAMAPEADESEATSPSVEGTKTVGRGVTNALARITRNIERRLEKFGWDEALPAGLMSVWQKFSTWLGNDTSVTPWTPPVSDDTSPTPDPSGDTSPTPPPSGEESPTSDPSAIVVPFAP